MYAYQEYPKAVKDKHDNEIVVRSPEEEAEITGKSVSSVQKSAQDNTAEQQADLDAENERVLDELKRRGSDVSEDDIVRMTAIAQDQGPESEEAPKKRGRPSNADKAAAAKEEGK